MACEICGRGACAYSFHNINDQNNYDQYASLSESQLIATCIDKDAEISDLKKEIEVLNAREMEK